MTTPLFERVTLIGIGLIGSSLARAIKKLGLANHVVVSTRSQGTLDKARELNLGQSYTTNPIEAVEDADLVVICVPMGAYKAVAEAIGPHLKPGCIVSDVGSTKVAVFEDVAPFLPENVTLVPGHPVAGTENSGPESGFSTLFQNRWCILTPDEKADEAAVQKIRDLWEHCGMNVDIMDAKHHDHVLAITSHLPQLIAYTIVSTATDLEEGLKKEVVKYSGGGFRDFTRIAASDPIMWRDIYMKNKDAVLDVLGRFTEDLTSLQRAIRRGEAQILEDAFTRTREIRRGVIEAKQDFIDVKPEDED